MRKKIKVRDIGFGFSAPFVNVLCFQRLFSVFVSLISLFFGGSYNRLVDEIPLVRCLVMIGVSLGLSKSAYLVSQVFFRPSTLQSCSVVAASLHAFSLGSNFICGHSFLVLFLHYSRGGKSSVDSYKQDEKSENFEIVNPQKVSIFKKIDHYF